MVLWDTTPHCLIYRFLLLPSSEPDNIASCPRIYCCKNLISQYYSSHRFLTFISYLSKHGEQGKISRFPCHEGQQKANTFNTERANHCSRFVSVSFSRSQYSKLNAISTHKSNLRKFKVTITK